MFFHEKNDISDFFVAHFSDKAVKAFSTQFLRPNEHIELPSSHAQDGPLQFDDRPSSLDWEWQEDGDDALGYYPDGVKRTLTDEQIEIFRHSELHALRRTTKKHSKDIVALSRPRPSKSASLAEDSPSAVNKIRVAHDLPKNEVQPAKTGAKKRKRRGKQIQQTNHEPKVDLRKRTWDVVEPGLDSLDYD